MYERKGIVYADPYKLLSTSSLVCFQGKGDLGDFIEVDAPLEDMVRVGDNILWGNGYCLQPVKEGKDYGYYKEKLIKRRYSLDDQMAIILNRDSDEEGSIQYDRMQSWREWAGEVAKKIMTLV